jgi:membrane protease subunit (stomatin/prohibitin family)
MGPFARQSPVQEGIYTASPARADMMQMQQQQPQHQQQQRQQQPVVVAATAVADNKFCSNCGKQVHGTFCSGCGTQQ